MTFKSGRKASPLTSLLDIILLVLFAQMILTSQLTKKNADEKIDEIEKTKNEEIEKIMRMNGELKRKYDEYFNESEDEKKTLEYDLKRVKDDVKEKNKEISSLSTSLEELKKESKKNIDRLTSDRNILEEEKRALIGKSNELNKEISVLKEDIENSEKIKVAYESQIKELSNYVRQYNKNQNGKTKEVSVRQIMTSAKALDELKSIVTLIEVELDENEIKLKLRESEEKIKWPSDDELLQKKDEVIVEKSELMQDKIKALFRKEGLPTNKVQILLIPSLNTGKINKLQRDFFKKLLKKDHIRDNTFIANVFVPEKWLELTKEFDDE